MKEIDTETTVVWPAWCYSGKSPLTNPRPLPHFYSQLQNGVFRSIMTTIVGLGEKLLKV